MPISKVDSVPSDLNINSDIMMDFIKNNTRKYISVFCCIFLLMLTGCSTNKEIKEPAAVIITDTAGHKEVIREMPRRVVILTTPLAEVYHALGGEITGISCGPEYDKPTYLANSEYVGLPYAINMEKVVAIKPDMVIGLNVLHNRYASILEQNNIPYLFFNFATYDDVKNTIRALALIKGNKENGERLISDLDKRMEETIKKYPKTEKTYAAIHGTGSGISLEVKGSIVCDVADKLGFLNVFPELTMKDIGNKPPFSLEELAMKNPDIIFLTTMARPGMEETIFANTLMTQPAWKEMKAVKNHQIYLLPQNLFLSGPGLNYPDALEYMAKKVCEK